MTTWRLRLLGNEGEWFLEDVIDVLEARKDISVVGDFMS